MLVYACFSTPCACICLPVYRRVAAVILPGPVSGRDKTCAPDDLFACFLLSTECLFLTLLFYIAAPSGFGEDLGDESRLNQILKIGELVPKLLASGEAFAKKLFPADAPTCSKQTDLPNIFGQAVEGFDERLRSSARGGAKTAMGLMMAHYPDAEPWRVASGFPELKKDGSLLKPEDEKAIMSSVAGYACKVANMVSLSTIFKDVPTPPYPEEDSDNEQEQAGDDA